MDLKMDLKMDLEMGQSDYYQERTWMINQRFVASFRDIDDTAHS